MDAKKKIRKHVPTSSSSSEDDDSSSSSSSSSDAHHKKHRASKKQRDSSSSSEGEFVRKSHKHQHKKSSIRKHTHSAKVRAKMLQANVKKVRSMSPDSRAAHKHHLKAKLAKKAKQLEDHERHLLRRSRTPVRRDIKKERTPEHRINSPTTRIRVSVPNNRVQERTAVRSLKDSPAANRRYIREPIDDRNEMSLMRQKEHEKIRRIQQEEEHYKYSSKVTERPARPMPAARMTPDKYHRERSRSSQGRIPIRERLDKEYDYHRSNSREHEEYPIARGPANKHEPPNRSYEYRADDRRLPSHDYGQSRPVYRWDENRETDTRGNRMYEGGNNNAGTKNWEQPVHERKRMPDDVPAYKERPWNENNSDKWSHKDKDQPEWKRGSWKDSASPQIAPTMPHPRRWPGPNSDNWNSPRGPPPHKMDSHSSSGPPFKPRGNAPPFFGYKRFPYKRFPNQYSKINFPSKRVIPSAMSGCSAGGNDKDDVSKGLSDSMDVKFEQQQMEQGNESGELTTEAEEEKIAQPDTTFSGTADAQYQEECEGNLSEFSDVDDDILNREEELARASAQESHQQSQQQPIQHDQQQPTAAEESSQDATSQKMISKIHANKELKKEMDLDFEEISDGELEQESAIKGFGDALGVDWASLAKETVSKSSDDFYESTRSRCTAHRILWDVGISVRFAGEDFARQTLLEAREKLRNEKHEWQLKKCRKLKDEKAGMNGDVKKEKIEGIKMEVEDEEEVEELKDVENDEQEDFELDNDVLLHPLAQVQVLMRKVAVKRKNLILNSTGKYGRALSARKDLKLRRQLCNLPKKDLNIDRSGTANAEINKHADEIYRKLVDMVN